MNSLPKKIIAISASIFVLTMVYYGSYLPYEKSKSFILAMNTLRGGSVKTLDDFFKVISVPLEMKSPIGQEEIVRQFTSYITGIIAQNNNPEIISLLIDYLNKYLEPILGRGKGLSFNQDLYLAGVLNLNAYNQTNDEKYLNNARKYFEFSYSLGPKRPQALFGLFDICRIKQDKECVKKYGDEILKYWPNDTEVKKYYDEFLKK
ncbi:MAG: hypothetical protein ACP5QN_02570 [Minisyncoccia bacterium]